MSRPSLSTSDEQDEEDSDLNIYSSSHLRNSGTFSYAPGPLIGDRSYSDIEGPGSDYSHSRRGSLADSIYPPPSTTGGGGGAPGTPGGGRSNRSRARAFSFLSTHNNNNDGQVVGSTTPAVPFSGEDYDYALRPEEEEEEEETDEDGQSSRRRASTASQVGGGGTVVGGGARRAYRQTFQPLVGYELWWMGASAGVVTLLTSAAVVLAVVS